jgi:ABC-type Zn uptake system ZnuABC Zn-binding protein ZnuA
VSGDPVEVATLISPDVDAHTYDSVPSNTESIATEAGMALAPSLYTDALGLQRSPGESYIGTMQSNVKTIVHTLEGDRG